MAQYIQHPALQGMEMGNRASSQRMNIYGQAVAQAADAINRQAAADQAYENELMKYHALMEAKINPITGGALTGDAPDNFAKEALANLRVRQMGQAGIGWSGLRLPGTVPLTGAAYGAFVPTEGWEERRPQGSQAITPEIMMQIARGGMPVQPGTPIAETTNNAPFPRPTKKARQAGFQFGE